MLSSFGDEMIRIAVSKEASLGRVGQGAVAGAIGTVGAQSGYRDWRQGRQIRLDRKRQMKAQRLMRG